MSVVGRTRHNVFQLQQPKFMFPIRRQKKKKGYQYARRRLPVEIRVELASLGICGTPQTNTSQP